eukprot:5425041-Amphidinium_carterae.1
MSSKRIALRTELARAGARGTVCGVSTVRSVPIQAKLTLTIIQQPAIQYGIGLETTRSVFDIHAASQMETGIRYALHDRCAAQEAMLCYAQSLH